MITMTEKDGRTGKARCDLVGLSTDAKPTTEIEGFGIINGSTFFEMDTGNAFMFDEQNARWYQI